MARIVIYYKQSKTESTEHVVNRINNLIQRIESYDIVVGVFVDTFNDNNKLLELLTSRLNELDKIYINKPLDDDFNKDLITQLSRTEHFEILLFNNQSYHG